LGSTSCSTNDLTPQELSLKQNLGVLRQVLEQFEGDHGKRPETLESLVTSGYVRIIPYDTITQSNQTWIVMTDDAASSSHRGVIGVRSGAPGLATDGTRYFDW